VHHDVDGIHFEPVDEVPDRESASSVPGDPEPFEPRRAVGPPNRGDHVVAGVDEVTAHVRPDEPAGAGDQDVHYSVIVQYQSPR
jgi:hypothetical protein